MKFLNFLKVVFAIGIIFGLFFWWWQRTTPDLPTDTSLPAPLAQDRVVPSNTLTPLRVAVSAKVSSSSPENATQSKHELGIDSSITSPSENINDAPLPPGWTREAIKAAHDYAEAHRNDQSTPAKVYLSVPLDQAEHHTFNLTSGAVMEVSITGYHKIPNGPAQGLDQVDLYVWQNSGPSHILTSTDFLSYFGPADQDYIRNWAQQQATPSPGSIAQIAPTMPSLQELRRQAIALGIPLTSPDWVSKVQAQLQANSATTSSATPVQDPAGAESPAAPQGATIITN